MLRNNAIKQRMNVRPTILISKVSQAISLLSLVVFAEPIFSMEFNCLIEARQTVEIRSSVEAIIDKIHVKRGDLVKQEDALVTLQSSVERASLKLAKTRATMQGEIRSAEAQLEFTSKKLTHAKELHDQKFVSTTALDEAEAEHKLATEQLLQAKENQILAQLEVKRTEAILALRTITSPLTGVVIESVLSPGEFASSNLKDPILKLVEINPLNVEVILPVSHYGSIKQDTMAIVIPEQPIGGEHQATVKIVDSVVDAASGTFGVRLELPNLDGKIPPGVRCKIEFPL